jgi:hypothetical protein
VNWFKSTYNIVFLGFLVSVVISFFYLRSFNSPWGRIINGDGLGYYSYLPAKYIYNDVNYEFKWFNKVYNTHYASSTFPDPEDNFLIKQGDRKINKYYQGLSYIWMPFFAVAHVYAKISGYPADGFSQPYQVFIGIASLLYLLLGLVFLRNLLQKLFFNPFVFTVVPIVFFYGTNLFFYGIHFNTLSHIYSFTFLTLFIYSFRLLFSKRENNLKNLLLCILWLTISVCIRPFNAIIILAIPAFLPGSILKGRFYFEKVRAAHVFILLLTAGAIFHQLNISYLQSGSFFQDTYTDEKFYFARSIFFDALFSYRVGLFVYAPLLLVALFGIIYLPRKEKIILPLFFFGILFLYSSWWYWPIVKRAMVDFYFIPAIFLGALLNRMHTVKKKVAMLILLGLTVIYYQFKNFQVSRGVLDEFYTYKEVFWRNFFRTNRTSMFLIPPSEILKQKECLENFESADFPGNRTEEKKYSGKYSFLLDSKNAIAKISECKIPVFFKQAGNKKIRVSFWLYPSKGVKQIQIFLQFLDKEGKKLEEVPFYINEESIYSNEWDYKEFGLELADRKNLNGDNVDKIVCITWNVEGKNKLYIDDAKVEFIITDNIHGTFK